MYLLIAVVVTSLLRDRIGLRTWRLVHWLTYAFWPIALIHGVGTGSDTNAPWMFAINVACIGGGRRRDRLALDRCGPRRLRWPRSCRHGFPRTSRMTQPDRPRRRPARRGRHVRPVPGRRRRRPSMGANRLLAGPLVTAAPSRSTRHRARLGPLPRHGSAMIPVLEETGLQGRGGAGFPVGRKWRTVAERPGGGAVVVANGAEGKPTSRKDRVLMALRPHLIIDGALIAADAVGAEEVVILVGQEHRPAVDAMQRAILERQAEFRQPGPVRRGAASATSSANPRPPSTGSTPPTRGRRPRRRASPRRASAACQRSCRTSRALRMRP